MARDLRDVALLVGVFALYVIGGKLGLQLSTVHVSATAVWPPTGIAIAALVVLGRRMWPAIAMGAFVVNVTTAGGPLAALGIALGNTLEALVAATLVTRYANGLHAFAHLGTLLRYSALAGFVATAVSATIGVSTLVVTGNAPLAQLPTIWLTWWLGDAGGAIVIAPFLVLWATPALMVRRAGDPAERIAFVALLGATLILVFAPVSPAAAQTAPIGYLTFPAMVWAAFRFGPRIAATTLVILSAGAVIGLLNGTGPWTTKDPTQSFLLLGGFMIVASVTTLALAASVVERQQAEEALRATEERLRRAEEAKVAARDELLSIAAHELRTPMTSLQLAAQMVLRELDKGRSASEAGTRTAIEVFRTQTERLGALVETLLDTVRIQTNRMDLLVVHDQDIGEIARRVASETQARTTRHTIEVNAHSPVVASVDAIRIQQVLRNLLDNAIKFSPSGKVTVDVSRQNGTVELSVRDHGPGIPPESRERIFDRFYQARSERTGDGLGLGLHVSRHIVELHGGEIHAEFPDDGGTRIVVILPVRTAPVPTPEDSGVDASVR